MENLDQLKSSLKRLIAENLGNALKKLDLALDDRKEAFNSFINLQREFNQMKRQSIRGQLSHEDSSRLERQFVIRLIEFLDSIETKDIRPTHHLQEEIYERILVVCKIEDRAPFMKRFFPKAFFKEVAFLPSDEPAAPETFDIIIFDNEPFDTDDGVHDLLQKYLALEKPRLLYFGKPLPLLYKYPEKAYYANSIFSLHARLQEMLTFLKYFHYED